MHLTRIKLPFVIKIFVLFIFEWPFYTRFTVHVSNMARGLSLVCLRATSNIVKVLTRLHCCVSIICLLQR